MKIGVTKRRSYINDVLSRMRAYRSRSVTPRAEFYIRGEAAGSRVKSAVIHALSDMGIKPTSGDWFAAAAVVRDVVVACASVERVRLLTEEEASQVEQDELEKLMENMLT